MYPTVSLSRWLSVSFAVLTAVVASAQTPDAFSIPAKQIDLQGVKYLKGAGKRVLLPTLQLEVMNWGKISSVTQTSALQTLGGASNSTARSTMEVAVPSDVAAYGAVATELYNDLAAKLTAAGWEVQTHADLKDDPVVAGIAVEPVDEKLGAAKNKVTIGKQKMHYTVVAPAGMPVVEISMMGPVFALRALPKSQNGSLLHVTYRFDPVALQGESRRGFTRNTASTSAEANLVLSQAIGMFVTPKGHLGSVRLKSAATVVGGVGEIKKAADVSPEFANGLSKALSFIGGGSISSQKGLYVCELDQAALNASLLVAGKTFNDEIVRGFGPAQ